jgi:hypothetical protein
MDVFASWYVVIIVIVIITIFRGSQRNFFKGFDEDFFFSLLYVFMKSFNLEL